METVRDLVEKFPELEAPGATFDYALPISWVDDVKEKTNIWPTEFVWYYPPRNEPGHIWGVPFPLTDEAKEILAKYEAALNEN